VAADEAVLSSTPHHEDVLAPNFHYRNGRNAKLRGLGVRVLPSGARRFFIHSQYRGERFRKIVGDAHTMRLEEARARAISTLAAIRREPVMRLVRYADDFVVLVHGTREDAETLWEEVAAVLAPMGLRLSEGKTRVCHVDEGFDFLGWRIQRRNRRGQHGKKAIYTYPSKKALSSIIGRVRKLTRRARWAFR